nr:MAG TPA: hypothetical protein [Caudoviricetes sp.]
MSSPLHSRRFDRLWQVPVTNFSYFTSVTNPTSIWRYPVPIQDYQCPTTMCESTHIMIGRYR